MNSQKTSGVRRWTWLAGGLLLLLMVGSIYGVVRSPDETFPFSGLEAQPPPPEGLVPMVDAVPEIDVERLAKSLAQALARHLDQRARRDFEELKENRLMQTRLIEEWKEEFDDKIEAQSSKLVDLNQRLHSIEHGVSRLLKTLEDEALQPSVEPTFVFRGIEIWHGQVYALLENEGRIVPVREGESRLGWRIHVIDRDGRKLHVGDGVQEHVLEVQ
ncbi:MAG: hypothetical protein OXG03_02895 [Gammaproteobacteria bacterium]|nr:hypothetical protein [Gammaproteobacteria bacterium]